MKRKGIPSARKLSELAGLSHGAVSHLIAGRSEHGRSDTWAKVVRVLEVNGDWLRTGNGDPLPSRWATYVDPHYQERADAARFAAANAIPDWAIEDVLQDRNLETARLSAEDWYQEMKSRARRPKGPPSSDPSDALDESIESARKR
jgi:hypothetical protein